MASKVEFVEYVCDQINGAGNITYKKMFGDYGIYCNNKIIGLVCDNQFFVKKTTAGETLLNSIEQGSPYPGAKPHFIIDNLDNRDFLSELIIQTYEELPVPRPKKKKSNK